MTAIEKQRIAARPVVNQVRLGVASLSHPIAFVLVCLVVAAGCALRFAAARGDLWLDELWSLDLVKPLRWPVEVFWAVPHDNNHPLNSLWMAILGPERPAMLYRSPAVLLGTATVAAAARHGWRTSPATGVSAALLTTCTYPLVLYGSEARGYAGLMLAVVLAIDLWEVILDARMTGVPLAHLAGPRWRLAGVVLFGTASHFTMLGALAMLGVATVIRRCPERGLLGAVDDAVTLFRPVLLLLTPFLALVAAGALVKGGFTIGATTPFTPQTFLAGYGGLLAALLGTRTVAPIWWALPIVGLVLAVGFANQLIDRRRLPLAIAALVLLPGTLFLVRMGNTEYPRYFLFAGLILPGLLAEMAGRLWTGGARVGAGLLIALPCLGQVPDLAMLLTAHRGAPTTALATVEPGARVLLRGDAPFAVAFVAAHYGRAAHLDLVTSEAPFPCAAPPGWLILDTEAGGRVPHTVAEGGEACPTRYALQRIDPSAPWSGRTWSLYRRAP